MAIVVSSYRGGMRRQHLGPQKDTPKRDTQLEHSKPSTQRRTLTFRSLGWPRGWKRKGRRGRLPKITTSKRKYVFIFHLLLCTVFPTVFCQLRAVTSCLFGRSNSIHCRRGCLGRITQASEFLFNETEEPKLEADVLIFEETQKETVSMRRTTHQTVGQAKVPNSRMMVT